MGLFIFLILERGGTKGRGGQKRLALHGKAAHGAAIFLLSVKRQVRWHQWLHARDVKCLSQLPHEVGARCFDWMSVFQIVLFLLKIFAGLAINSSFDRF